MKDESNAAAEAQRTERKAQATAKRFNTENTEERRRAQRKKERSFAALASPRISGQAG
jgi:hypothetical protein